MIVDALLVAAWAALALETLRGARRDRAAQATHGAMVAGWGQPPAALGIALLVVAAVAVVLLERETGRWPARPALVATGLLLVGAGVLLHRRARRTLGPLWSGGVVVRERHPVVAAGPYAVVRHPIYLAMLLVAVGTLLAHPSQATACVALGVAAGVALKIPLEERVLRRLPDDRYRDYAARVPALLPRPSALAAVIRDRRR